MQNRSFRIGPVSLAAAAANIFNCPTITGGVGVPSDVTATYAIIKKIRVVNHTAGIVNGSLFIGATGASAVGTEFMISASPVPAQATGTNWLEWTGALRLTSTDFLTGFASAAASLTIELEGEIGVAG